MKKGMEYIGNVIRTDFPNRGIIDYEGEKVIVKDAIEGQKIRYAISKARKNRNEGKIHEVIERSPLETREPLCPHFDMCGGCTYQRLEYSEQLKMKAAQVKRILENSGCEDFEFLGIEPSPSESGYRNKMEFSFGDNCKGGELTLGLHKAESFYDILQITDCKIINNDYNEIIKCIISICRSKKLSYCHKVTHIGYLRHLLIRRAATTGEILVNLVTTSQWDANPYCSENFTEEDFLDELVESLLALDLNGNIVGILHTVNNDPSDAIRVERTDTLYGKDFYFEEILGQVFKITTFSFFQTNSFGAEKLYSIARDFVGETKDKVVFDLYSGTGTIAQILAPVAKKVIGVEIVEEAVESAKINAALNNLDNCEFICGDVLKVLDDITDKPDIIVLDPPREGIHPKALEKIIAYGVQNLVYISCKPTSLAQNLDAFREGGYRVEKVKCCDMFPQTVHVETVCLLSKLHEAKHHVNVKLDMDELDLTSAESKATYEEIKKYVAEHNDGMKVSNLYIAQVKRKCGIELAENYNLPKSEDSRQPQCPKEKEEAIMEALKAFQMI